MPPLTTTKDVVTFQSPGVNAADAAKMDAHNASAAPEDRVHSTHHRNSDDAIHLAGEALTDGVVYTFDRQGDSKIDAHRDGVLNELNDERGNQVARTFSGGAFKKERDAQGNSEIRADAYQEKSTLEGVKVSSTREGTQGGGHDFIESGRKGLGRFIDGTVGAFDQEVDSRDDYVRAWDTAKAMHTGGSSLRDVNDYIATADDLLPEQRLRMANQMSKLFA